MDALLTEDASDLQHGNAAATGAGARDWDAAMVRVFGEAAEGEFSATFREVASPLPRVIRPLGRRCERVQFSRLLTDADFRRLARFLQRYPDVTSRAYGGYDGRLRDLDWLQHFPRLRRLHADALYELDDIAGLQSLPEDLVELTLGQTRRKLSWRDWTGSSACAGSTWKGTPRTSRWSRGSPS